MSSRPQRHLSFLIAALIGAACQADSDLRGDEVAWVDEPPSASPTATVTDSMTDDGDDTGGDNSTTNGSTTSESTSGGTGGGTTGGTGGGTDGGTGSPDPTLALIDLTAVCDHHGGSPTSSLSATASKDSIEVSHTGLIEHCCAEWTAELSTAEDTLDKNVLMVSYGDAAEDTCDCECSWTLDYTLIGMEPGTWTVSANGAEDTVKVAR